MFDPANPTLRRRLAKGDCIGAVWLSLGSVALCELAALSRPDAIVIDMQHGLWDRLSLEAAIGVTPSSVPVLVRVGENTAAAIGQALDAGAEGVIVPLVESAEAARAAVAAARYPPKGTRSGGGIRPLAHFPDYVAAAGALVVAVMIETRLGLRHARAIAAVPGVDMVFIGTGDLALSIGAFPADTARTDLDPLRKLALLFEPQNVLRRVRHQLPKFFLGDDAGNLGRHRGGSTAVHIPPGDNVWPTDGLPSIVLYFLLFR